MTENEQKIIDFCTAKKGWFYNIKDGSDAKELETGRYVIDTENHFANCNWVMYKYFSLTKPEPKISVGDFVLYIGELCKARRIENDRVVFTDNSWLNKKEYTRLPQNLQDSLNEFIKQQTKE